ncbi:MAG: trigger factor, partial [Clostridiales bacterium]|nr:trigger factor [Clostridiales bacterium]
YGTDIFFDDAINEVYPEAIEAAVEESGLEIIDDQPDFELVNAVQGEPLVFKATLTVKPEVEIGEYKGLTAAKKAVEVKDSDVDVELSRLQERNGRIVAVEDRAAELTDNVTIDFEGFIDGVAFEGGKGEDTPLTLGSGQFIPGFEEQIVGHSTGDEFDVTVTFPEDYHAEELKGKEAVFKTKLHEIKTRELPELDDEFAKDVSEFDTLDELKADIRAKLQEKREKLSEDDVENQLIDQLIEGLKAEIPEAMFERRIDDNVRDFDSRLRSQGLDVNSYLQYTGMEMSAFRKTFREVAERQVKVRLALEKITQIEDIKPSDEELDAEFKKLAEAYNLELDKVKAIIPAKELTRDLAVEKAIQLVKDSAVITDAPAEEEVKAEEAAPAAEAEEKTEE